MAKAGDELVNPVTGLRTVFRKTAQETSGELLQVSESYFLEPILGGEVVLPAGDVPEPFVDADDVADVAVAALTEGVQRAVGREPRDFADYAREAAATGIWDVGR
jgi:uncharacterized protein YbjT (DUF2867 family)